jgi:Xaa-Pro aminopeptidase
MHNNDHYAKRVQRLSETNRSVMILKDENIYYFSGFYAKDSNSVLLILEKEVFLLVNFLYFEEAKKAIHNENIKIVSMKKDRFSETVNIVNDYRIESIGFEFSFISHKDFLNISANLEKRNTRIDDISNTIGNLRAIKDQYELKNISIAADIADKIYMDLIESGSDFFSLKNEALLSLEIEKKIIKGGGEKKSFDFVVAFNENSSRPHYFPDDVQIGQGIILLDYGAKYKNYCSDITRTFFLKNNNKFAKIYDIVLNAQMLAIEKVKEGVSTKEVDAVARNYIKSKGYGDYFGHGLGHGVGLEIHEEPYLSQNNETILKENMVVTIEPGIYIEGAGGVRIEDMLIVKKDSSINLYQSDKKIINII